jgi:hypothetical protein
VDTLQLQKMTRALLKRRRLTTQQRILNVQSIIPMKTAPPKMVEHRTKAPNSASWIGKEDFPGPLLFANS